MSASKTLVAKTSKVTRAPPVHIPRSITLQPSLQVGAVNDPAEREAEAMASRVVASSAPAMLVPPDPKPGQNPSLRRSVEDQPNLDDLATPSVPAEQADVTVASPEDVETTDLKTEDTDELDQGTPQDTSGEAPAEDAPPIPDAPFPIMEMRRAETGAVVGRSGGAAPNDVASIVAAPGPGRPLPRAVRNRIEPHFGTSFADVRLHDSPADRRAAARIGARAFTHKNRIWLGDGESETNTRLMAHELTHVVQQTKGSETLPLAREPAVIRRGYFADKAESVARHLPGYTLLTVLVGRKFISGARVAMTAENLLAGFLGLIFGGALIFDRLKEAGVIEEAFDFVKGKLSELNLTWDRIKGDISEALDTLDPFKAARNIKNMIIGFVRDITRFVTAIAKKFLEFIVRGALKLAGSMGDQVWAILQKAGDTLNLILEDPLGFAKNLISSIVGGFQQFGTNILEHLKKGLLGWLFGSLTSAGIKLPEKLDFKGLISLVLQIIGVTYENFRKRLVKNLGPKGEKMVTMMEKSVEVVKILLKEGFAGIWQKLLGMIDSFKETMLGGLTTMVRDTLVKAGIGWLASLSNPVGAIVKIVLSIYNLIVTFIERFQQIKDVAEGIFSSIGSIAKGQIAKARDFIEETIGRTVPVVISFVAALIPISGITAKIQNVIKKLKQPVDKAMDKMITFVKNKAKKLFSKLIAKVNGKRKYPSVNFKIGAKQHRIFAKQNKSGKIEVQMASTTPEVIDEKEKGQAEELAKIAKADGPAAPEAAKIGKAIQKQTSDADNETAAEAKKIKGKSKKENQLDKIKQLEDELNEAAKELTTAAVLIDTNPHISSQSKDLLFRAAEPRIAAIEGQQDTHAALLKRSKTEFNTHIPDEVSSFYEMDHTIEKRFAKAILENLHLLDPDEVENRADEKAGLSADQRADRAAAYNANLDAKKAAGEKGLGHKAGKKTALPGEDAPPLGKIGTGEFAKIPETAPLFPAVAMYRHNHITNKGLSSTGPMIEDARKTKDPHGSVKKTIAAQLKLETEAMSAAIGADPNATPQLIKNVQDGIEKARNIWSGITSSTRPIQTRPRVWAC